MRLISEATSRVTGRSFQRKYIALGRIVNAWEEIVGEELATKAQPVRLRYRKHDKSGAPNTTLEISVSGAEATLLHYQKDLILERLNQIFGERWITGIRFVQTPANTPPLRRRKAKTPLTAQEKNTLSGIISAVGDPEIRSRLSHLGEAIITGSKE